MKETHRLRWLPLLFAWLLSSCHADEAPQKPQSTPHDLIGQSLERALDYSEQVSDFFEGPPRKAPRGARPELIVENNRITLDGKPLELAAPVAEWWKVLGPPSRQDRNGLVHVWDKLGVGVTARIDERTTHAVEDLTKQLFDSGLENDDNAQRDKDRNRTRILRQARELGNFEVSSFWVNLTGSPPPDDVNEDGEPSPRHAFPGYLQVNGIGVDAKSTVRDFSRGSRKASPPLMFLGCLRGTQTCEADAEVSKNSPRMLFSFGIDETEQRHITDFGFSCERCPRPAR